MMGPEPRDGVSGRGARLASPRWILGFRCESRRRVAGSSFTNDAARYDYLSRELLPCDTAVTMKIAYASRAIVLAVSLLSLACSESDGHDCPDDHDEELVVQPNSSRPGNFRIVGEHLMFHAIDREGRKTVWRLAAGDDPETIESVLDDGLLPSGGIAWRGEYYYGARRAAGDYDVWRTDGERNERASTRVEAFRLFPYGFTLFDDALYFAADDGVMGTELWKLDTEDEASLVADLVPGPDDSDPGSFMVFGDRLLFNVERFTLMELEDDLPRLLADDLRVMQHAIVDDVIYLGGTDSMWESVFYRYDGIDPPEKLPLLVEGEMREYDGLLHFHGPNGEREALWTWDGEGDPQLVFEVELGSRIDLVGEYDGELYFISGGGLWQYTSG